jgi:hypothetical protein
MAKKNFKYDRLAEEIKVAVTDIINEEIDSINLEKYIIENNLKKPTLIKCDIEGAEYKFINSVSDSFFNTVRIFILEFHFLDANHKYEMYKILERFLSIGYTIRLSNISKFENNVGTLIFEKM